MELKKSCDSVPLGVKIFSFVYNLWQEVKMCWLNILYRCSSLLCPICNKKPKCADYKGAPHFCAQFVGGKKMCWLIPHCCAQFVPKSQMCWLYSTVTVLTPHCCAQFETRNRNCAGSNPPVFPICGKKPKRADYTHHGCAGYNDVNYYPQSDGYQGKKQPLGLRPFVRQWWWWWGRPVSALGLSRNLSSTPPRALYRLSANISPCVHSKKIFCTSMLM